MRLSNKGEDELNRIVPWVEKNGNINLINGYNINFSQNVYDFPGEWTTEENKEGFLKEECFVDVISDYLINNGFVIDEKNTREEWDFYGLEKDNIRVLVDGHYTLLSLGNIDNKVELGEITINDYNEIHTLFSDEEYKPLTNVFIDTIIDDFVSGWVVARTGGSGFIVKKDNGKWRYLTASVVWYADCEVVVKENIPLILTDFYCWSEEDGGIMKYNEENNSWESIIEEDSVG